MMVLRQIFTATLIIFALGEKSLAQYYGGNDQDTNEEGANPLNSDKPSPVETNGQPTLLLESEPSTRVGVIEMIIPQQNRLVIGDQSINLSKDVEVNTEKRRRLYGVNNLKRGMTVRINTEIFKGQVVATEITELKKPNKYKNQRNRKNNKTNQKRDRRNNQRNNNTGYGTY